MPGILTSFFLLLLTLSNLQSNGTSDSKLSIFTRLKPCADIQMVSHPFRSIAKSTQKFILRGVHVLLKGLLIQSLSVRGARREEEMAGFWVLVHAGTLGSVF